MSQLDSLSPWTLICHLLFHSGPSAIIGRVWSVVVDSINGQAGRARPHIQNKGGVVIPPRTDRDSPTAIVFVSLVSGIVASIPHRGPDEIERGVRLSVDEGPCAETLSSDASAPDGIACRDVVDALKRSVSAVAEEFPDDTFALAFRSWSDGREASKALTRDVPNLSHA